jgi:hypothetical protein
MPFLKQLPIRKLDNYVEFFKRWIRLHLPWVASLVMTHAEHRDPPLSCIGAVRARYRPVEALPSFRNIEDSIIPCRRYSQFQLPFEMWIDVNHTQFLNLVMRIASFYCARPMRIKVISGKVPGLGITSHATVGFRHWHIFWLAGLGNQHEVVYATISLNWVNNSCPRASAILISQINMMCYC